ncbi:hypothetical protein HUJ04_009374, partial [Dendroctonus ponderosae]
NERNMYEPVVTRCITPTSNVQRACNYSNLIQIGNFQPMDLDNKCNATGNNNNKEAVPPSKPPRLFQTRRSLRNSSSTDTPGKMKNGTGDFYVDMDHIQVGFRGTAKGEQTTAEAEVQTTHLVPYRLRFWPRTDCKFKLGPSESSCSLKCKCCCQLLSQWMLSQVGLTIVVIIWALLGAYAFYVTEGPREQKQSETLAQIQKDLSTALAVDLNNSKHLDTWPTMIHKYFEKHETLFLEAVGAGFGEGGGGNIWTYPGCILFSVALLTTLGFGAPVPRTPLGRGAAVLFALVGIPLHFLLVLNVGNLTAIKIQQFAFRSRPTDIPGVSEPPRWLKWFPFIAALIYYFCGVIMFGFVRGRRPLHAFMFPLDFTASGGVASVPG